jgi:hypothetical protein
LSARGYFFTPDPQTLADCGKPSAPRRVDDHTFDTFDQALQAAQTQDPAADPNKWVDQSWFDGYREGGGFPNLELGPEAMRVGAVGRLVAGAAGLAIFAAVVWAGISLGVDMHVLVERASWADLLDPSPDVGPGPAAVWLLLGAFMAGASGFGITEWLLKRRNLARERDR